MPGVESFEIVDDDALAARRSRSRSASAALRIAFAFEKTEARAPEYARLQAKGKGVGAIIEHGDPVRPERGRRRHGHALGGGRAASLGQVARMGQRVSSRS